MPASVMSSVAPVWAKAEHVSDDFVVTRAYKLMSMRIEAYELINIPPNRVLEAARSVLSQALAPADFELAKREVQLLWLGTRHKIELAEDEEKAMLADYSEALSNYPQDVIVGTCRGKPRWEFWPSRGAVLNRADALMQERMQLADALLPEAVERAQLRIEAEAEVRRRKAEWRPPTDEEKAAVSELARQAREVLVGAVPKRDAARRPEWWMGSERQRLFARVLSTVNVLAAHLGGQAGVQAWAVVAAGNKAGSWRAMSQDDRTQLRELYRTAKSLKLTAEGSE